MLFHRLALVHAVLLASSSALDDDTGRRNLRPVHLLYRTWNNPEGPKHIFKNDCRRKHNREGYNCTEMELHDPPALLPPTAAPSESSTNWEYTATPSPSAATSRRSLRSPSRRRLEPTHTASPMAAPSPGNTEAPSAAPTTAPTITSSPTWMPTTWTTSEPSNSEPTGMPADGDASSPKEPSPAPTTAPTWAPSTSEPTLLSTTTSTTEDTTDTGLRNLRSPSRHRLEPADTGHTWYVTDPNSQARVPKYWDSQYQSQHQSEYPGPKGPEILLDAAPALPSPAPSLEPTSKDDDAADCGMDPIFQRSGETKIKIQTYRCCQIIVMTFQLDDTIFDVERRIEQFPNLYCPNPNPQSETEPQQYLTLNGKQLDDDQKTIADYQIQCGDTLRYPHCD